MAHDKVSMVKQKTVLMNVTVAEYCIYYIILWYGQKGVGFRGSIHLSLLPIPEACNYRLSKSYTGTQLWLLNNICQGKMLCRSVRRDTFQLYYRAKLESPHHS